MTDKELRETIMQQPEKGIERAIEQYGGLVNAIVIKMIGKGSGADVQECISDVFIRLWKYIGGFDESKGTLKAYIVTIARNEAFRKLKSMQKDHYEQSLEDLDIGVDIDMTYEVAKKSNKKIISETIEYLKEPDRQIFIRRYFWGERVKFIAKALNLEEKFVENRLYLVKKKLREQLIERGIII